VAESQNDAISTWSAAFLHETIRNAGRGAYSHWDRSLIFSTSDGSDPRTNARTYTASERIHLSWTIGFPALVIALLILARGMRDLWRLAPKSLRIYERTGLRWVVHNVVPGLLVSVVIVVALAAGTEIYTRSAFPFVDTIWPSKFLPDVGFVFEPHATLRHTNLRDFWNEDRINSIGFLDREPPSGLPGDGVDSFVEAAQVPIKDKFQIRFEQAFNERARDFKVETIALGFSGTGQINQIPFYDQYVRRLRPSVVVLVIVANDFSNNSALLETMRNGWHPLHAPRLFAKRDPRSGNIDFQAIDPKWQSHLLPVLSPRPVFWRPLHEELSRVSLAYRWIFSLLRSNYSRAAMAISGEPDYRDQVASRIASLRSDPESEVLMADWNDAAFTELDSDFFKPDPLQQSFQEAIAFTDFALAKWAERTQQDGAKLLALTTQSLTQGNPEATSRYLDRFQTLLRKRNIDEIDQSLFAKTRGHRFADGHWKYDGHWNILGHLRTAELLVDYFSGHPEICRSNTASIKIRGGDAK
jgi:hypothetical protein